MPGDSGGRSDGHGRERGWNIRQPISRRVGHLRAYMQMAYLRTMQIMLRLPSSRPIGQRSPANSS